MNSKQPEGERLSKRIMQLRDCSRSQAEQYIEAGFVRVDGVVVEEPQFRVRAQQVVIDDHASLLKLTAVTLILNKPAGYQDGLEPWPPARDTQPARTPKHARSLLTAEQRSADDETGTRLLKSHLRQLEASVPLEQLASGLVVFTQDFRVQRKLIEEMALMEHELIIDVRGEVAPDALHEMTRAMRDARLRLPDYKVSLSSASSERSKLRLAVKGAHPGLAAYLCDLAGLQMVALRRIRLGRVNLGRLEAGTWRYLGQGERF